MKVTIKNIETKEITTLDEEQTVMYEEGILEMETISGVNTSDENWGSLVEEIWERKNKVKKGHKMEAIIENFDIRALNTEPQKSIAPLYTEEGQRQIMEDLKDFRI